MKKKLFALLIPALLACLWGCDRDGFGRRTHDNNEEEKKDPAEQFSPNRNWAISYDGRSEITEDGIAADVENITLKSTDEQTYYLDVISAYSFKEDYGSSLQDYFNAELQMLKENAEQEKCRVADLLDHGNVSYSFDRLESGDWIAFAIGIGSSGALSGDYARLDFTIQEETPTDAYNAWLGTWKVTGKDKNGKERAYDLKISREDANFMYLVKGWECGKDGAKDAEDLDFIAMFNRWTGSLYINGQFIRWFQDNNIYYDTWLCGHFYYDGNKYEKDYYFLNDTVTLGEAILSADGEKAEMDGCQISVYMDDTEIWTTTFAAMQYIDIPDSDKADPLVYAETVPLFPLQMTLSSRETKARGEVSSLRREAPAKAVRHEAAPAQSRSRITSLHAVRSRRPQ